MVNPFKLLLKARIGCRKLDIKHVVESAHRVLQVTHVIRVSCDVRGRLRCNDSVELGEIEIIELQIRLKNGSETGFVRNHGNNSGVDIMSAQRIPQTVVETFRSSYLPGCRRSSDDCDFLAHAGLRAAGRRSRDRQSSSLPNLV